MSTPAPHSVVIHLWPRPEQRDLDPDPGGRAVLASLPLPPTEAVARAA